MLFSPLQAKKEADNLGSALVLIVVAEAMYEAVAELDFKPLAELSSMVLKSIWD